MNRKAWHLRKRDVAVLVLCAVLLAFSVGAVGRAGRGRATEMVCLANLHKWGAMFQAYVDDHDGQFNPGWDVGETTLWMNALRPYYQDRWNLLLCPTATRPVEGPTDSGTFRAWYRNISLPGGGMHRYVGSYGINSWTNNMTTSRGARQESWFWKTTQGVQDRHNVPVFADSAWHDAWPLHTDQPPTFPLDSGWGNVGTADEVNHFCIDRHNGAVNFLFMDWSARKVGLKELWTLKWHRNFNPAGPWTKAGGVLPSDWPQWMRQFKDY